MNVFIFLKLDILKMSKMTFAILRPTQGPEKVTLQHNALIYDFFLENSVTELFGHFWTFLADAFWTRSV